MSKIEKIISPKLKNYFILLTVSIFVIIVILNSNRSNNPKNRPNLKQEKRNFFGKLFSNRLLEEIEKERNNSTKICEKTSDKLQKYYETGDKTIFGLDDDKIKGEDGEHIKALINIAKITFAKKEKEINTDTNKTRLLEENQNGEILDNLIIYGKHYLPLIIILGIAILSFPGWILCLTLCCCDCRCCCCCVKPCCKIPSFVFSYIFYGIVALVCFYGLGKSNSIFIGIADTECSILKFVDEAVEGESKQNPPYWAGIERITEILDNLSGKVENMKSDTELILNDQKTDLDGKKDLFEDNLDSGSQTINEECSSETSCLDYFFTDGSGGKKYQLDIAKKFGTYNSDNGKALPENSICDLWKKEYDLTASNANKNFKDTIDSFGVILNQNDVSSSLDSSKKSMKEIKDSFDEIKLIIAGNIIKYGDNTDKYGRLTFYLLYTILIMMDAGIAAFMLLLCFCSGRICDCCCCARCFCKFFIHILWNLMAVCMVVLFLAGSLFTLFGKMGEDMISVFAYLVGEENLGQTNDTILFGDVKKYLNKCFNDNGDILSELGFKMESMKNFQVLKNAELQLNDIEEEFKDKNKKFVYSEYLLELDKKVNYNSEDLSFIEVDTSNPSTIKFKDLLNSVNIISTREDKKETWDIASTSTKTCSIGDSYIPTSPTIYHPKKCWPTNKAWINDYELNNEIEKLTLFKDKLELADNLGVDKGIRKILNGLNSNYDDFLKAEIDTIDKFKKAIQSLTNITLEVSGEEEGFFSFINCKFINSNMQIILVNLKNAFGGDLYMIGIYLLMAAFSLAFAISFTILLTVILKLQMEDNQQKEKNNQNNQNIQNTGGEDIPEYPMNTSKEKYLPNKK